MTRFFQTEVYNIFDGIKFCLNICKFNMLYGLQNQKNTTTVYKIGEWTISCILIFVINVHIFRKECTCAGHYIYTFSKYMYFSSECYLYNTFLLLFDTTSQS